MQRARSRDVANDDTIACSITSPRVRLGQGFYMLNGFQYQDQDFPSVTDWLCWSTSRRDKLLCEMCSWVLQVNAVRL